jgi:flavin reductase (DIM6/NTAB) family NADH-FMN oxidoreductase RutF
VTPPFDRITGALDHPMYVVSAAHGSERDACLVGFATQCSIAPARYLVCLSERNRTFEIAQHATTLVVHVLHRGDDAVARHFGEETEKPNPDSPTSGKVVADKLEGWAWSAGPGGAPVLDGLDWFAGSIVERVDLGDHTGVLLEVAADGRADRADEPLLGFQALSDLEPGQPA